MERKIRETTRQVMALFLAIAMCFAFLPSTVLAAEDESSETEDIVILSADDVGEADSEAESTEEETPEVTDVAEDSETEDPENAIKELSVSEEPEEEEADEEDEEPDENEPMTLAVGDPIYLNGEDGDDSSDGATTDTAVATFDKAKDLAIENSTSTIYICGTVTYSSGESTIDGSVDGGDNLTLLRYEEDTSEVLILVEGGTLTLSNITIDDNYVEETEPMVMVDGSDAVLNITDGTVIQNAYEDPNTVRGKAGDSGAVALLEGTLNMSGGLITNNTGGYEGGGVHVNATAGDTEAVFNFSGGTISYNSANWGGGISLLGNVTLNMTGGEVTHNTATTEGGGIMVDQDATAIISGGYITYNQQMTALDWGGGGIYVGINSTTGTDAGNLYLYNVEIAYNSVLDDPQDQYTERRATVACCNTGELQVHLTEGEVFHDNYDKNTVMVWRTSGTAIFNLSPIMLGGYPYHWTDENGNELPLNELIDSHDGYFQAITAVSTENGTVSGLDRCTTHICYNQAAGLGSAISTNGNTQIGYDDGDVSIAIEKNWTDVDQMEGVTLPDEVNVVVYSVDSEGNKTYVGYETLTAEEGWKKTIEDLPKYDSIGGEFEYIVEESEESIHGWFSMVTGGKTESSGDDYYDDEEKTAHYEFTVTNTPIELLNLSKTVDGPADTDEFEFKITLYEPGDTDEEGNLNYYPYKGDVSVAYTIDGETTTDTLTFDEGVAYVTLPADGSASLEIGDGMQWWIEEITEGANSTSYTVDGGEPQEGTSAEGMIGTDNVNVVFANTYEAQPKITKEEFEDDYSRKDEDIEHDDSYGHFEENIEGDGWGSWDDADNNQEITYHITLTDIRGAVNVTVHDYLEDGLDFEPDTVTIDLYDEGEHVRTLEEVTDYVKYQGKCLDPNGCAMDGCTFEIWFKDEVFQGLTPDAYLVITYKALTDTHEEDYDDYEDEILNYSYMTYGANSYRSDIVTTETDLFGFGVYKYSVEDEEEVTLAGAEFVLQKDGQYATFKIETDDSDRNHDIYYMVTGWEDEQTEDSILVTGKDGMIRIEGLDDDTYTLTEVNAPAGYEIMATEPITVVIDEDGSVTFDGNSDSIRKDETYVHEVDVQNEQILTNVEGSKTWDDNDDQDGDRPDEITIYLLADNEIIDTKTVTPDADGNWTWSFTDLPMYKDGVEISYHVIEQSNEGYSVSYPAGTYDIVNTHTPDQTSVSVVKAWEDNGDQDGERPESITVRLLADGEDTGRTLVLDDSNDWRGSFEELDIYHDQGEKIVYTIEEDDIADYESSIIEIGENSYAFAIVNEHVPEETEITVHKHWDDGNDQDGIRPDEVTVVLTGTYVNDDGNKVECSTQYMTISAENNWTAEFYELPVHYKGYEITYTISEIEVEGYETIVDGYEITNTHIPETVKISGIKVWDDENDYDNIRPESITVNLMANGVKVDSVTVTEEDDWAWSFSDLDKFDKEGQEIIYSVEEETVEGYDDPDILKVGDNDFVIVNSHTPEKPVTEMTYVFGIKVWDDDNDIDNIRPESITVNLLANGEPVDNKEVTADTNWMWSFTSLEKYDAEGNEIVYTVEEDAVKDYVTEIDGDQENGFTITNTHTPGEISETIYVSGMKIWDDDDNADGIRPESIMVNLYANDEKVDYQEVEPDEEGNWAWSFADLDKYDADGNEIAYTVTEDEVEGYDTYIDQIPDTNTYIITNTHTTEEETPETVNVSGVKVWDDKENADGIRPDSITVNLLVNDEKIDSMEVTEDTYWIWSFNDLDKYDEDGNEIEYTVDEDEVKDYTAEITGDQENGFKITNTHTPEGSTTDNPTGTPTSGRNGGSTPKTGDTNHLGVWIALMMACAVIVGDLIYMRRRANRISRRNSRRR